MHVFFLAWAIIAPFGTSAFAVCPHVTTCEDIQLNRAKSLRPSTTEATVCKDCTHSEIADDVMSEIVGPSSPQAQKFLACLKSAVQASRQREIDDADKIFAELKSLNITEVTVADIQTVPEVQPAVDGLKPSLDNLFRDPKGKALEPADIFATLQSALMGDDKRTEYFPDARQAAITPWVAKRVFVHLIIQSSKTPQKKKSYALKFAEPGDPEAANRQTIQKCLRAQGETILDFHSGTGTPKALRVDPHLPSTCEFEWSPGDLVATDDHTFVFLGYTERKGGIEINTLEDPGRNLRRFNITKRKLYAESNTSCSGLDLNTHGVHAATVWHWK